MKKTLLIVVGFVIFSCNKKIDNITVQKKMPVGEVDNFTMYYTLSGFLKAVLKSEKQIDYSNQPFKYNEFPSGLEVTFFNDKGQNTKMTSDYAIIYQQTNIVKMEGHVVIITANNSVLKTERLFWDRKNDWVFTEDLFNFLNTNDDTMMDGKGMDFDKSFAIVKAHKTYGVVTIEDNKQN